MTVFPASGATGKLGKALTGTVTTTMSPAAAASPLVAADARGPSSAARPARVAEHHLGPGLDGEPRDGTADLSASDEPHSRHILSVPSRRPWSFAGLVAIRGPCRQLAGK